MYIPIYFSSISSEKQCKALKVWWSWAPAPTGLQHIKPFPHWSLCTQTWPSTLQIRAPNKETLQSGLTTTTFGTQRKGLAQCLNSEKAGKHSEVWAAPLVSLSLSEHLSDCQWTSFRDPLIGEHAGWLLSRSWCCCSQPGNVQDPLESRPLLWPYHENINTRPSYHVYRPGKLLR